MDVVDLISSEEPNSVGLIDYSMSEVLLDVNDKVVAQYKDYVLSSAFQPIVSVPHARTVGFEALVRAKSSDGVPCSPLSLFSQADSATEHLELDRLCRQVHLKNFARQDNGEQWLFLNLDSESLSVEKPVPGFMSHILSASNIPAHRIVIEILESKIADKSYILNIINHFRSMGCLIAIDDFGAGHSNFDRIWELSPDIVKLDKSLICRAAVDPRIKRILNGMTSLLHEAGSLVLVEGVETKQEALVAIESNADMLQGFYFSRPEVTLIDDGELKSMISELMTDSKNFRREQAARLSNNLENLTGLFTKTIQKLESKHTLEEAFEPLLAAEVVSCYLIDEQGQQIRKTIHSKSYHKNLDQRYLPLMGGEQANWSQKHYHYRALANPNEINISRPYLSVAGAEMCVTVSKVVMIDHAKYVLCCDLAWLDTE